MRVWSEMTKEEQAEVSRFVAALEAPVGTPVVPAQPQSDLLSRIDELCELASEARATLTQLDMQLAALREELQPGPRRVRVTLEGTHGWVGTVVGAHGAGPLVVRRDEDGVSFTVVERQVVDLTPEPKP